MCGSADVLNFNIGILGHVDSGKTSLCVAMSTIASTASFDKNPQSAERKITLDLGFSSFILDSPPSISQYSKVQYTLVDCPGHASLFRSVIGASQIIDFIFLVVDATKGFQTQTAECLVLGQVTCKHMIVVVNKIDLIPESKRTLSLEKLKKKLSTTIGKTHFSGSPIVCVAAKPGGGEGSSSESMMGMDILIDTLKQMTYLPVRQSTGNFLFSADHCFSLKGQGTVITGTVLNGSISVGDSVEISSVKVVKKIKSIQRFKKPVNSIMQGDRAGICITQFDSTLLERGLVCKPSSLPTVYSAIISIHRIPYFKGKIIHKTKYHLSIGHETVMGRLSLFCLPEFEGISTDSVFEFGKEYLHLDELQIPSGEAQCNEVITFALVEFERPILFPSNSLIIGSRLDVDINSNSCRLAFHGRVCESFTEEGYRESILPKIFVYKVKEKEGIVERLIDEYSVVVKDMFKKETNLDAFANLNVSLTTGEVGYIEGTFGQSGKIKVCFRKALLPSTIAVLPTSGKKKEKSTDKLFNVKVVARYRRYVFDRKKRFLSV